MPRNRKYELAKVGDTFGAAVVIALAKDSPRGDQRATWRCTCGAEGTSLVSNLRKRSAKCTHGRKNWGWTGRAA